LPQDQYIQNACAGHAVSNFPASNTTDSAGLHSHTITLGGDAESRSINIYLDYIIRALPSAV
jgi:hypothetical protein